eukprot:maker-scaffold_6-snap-gene-17.30-mRNA-1 protein AED:0.20 eAED:0.20 QI:37/1/1/1/0.5/0.33/3/104/251
MTSDAANKLPKIISLILGNQKKNQKTTKMSVLPPLATISTTDLGKFNGYISLKSYIEGYQPTTKDVEVFKAFKEAPDAKKAVHAARWYSHIASFSEEERSKWSAPSAAEETPAAAPPADDDDPFGDDDDLFAEPSEEEAKALQEKLKKEAIERGKKKLKNARSMIVLEVKPYEADFDLEELAKQIKTISHEGIQNWGAEHKLEPVAFGIKKLIISAVVYDELCGVDDLSDMILEKYEDDIQSIDVQAMSKV